MNVAGDYIAVGLGGNVGSDQAILARFRAAIRLLRVAGAFDVRASSVYRSPPAGPVANQPPFLNAAVAFQLPPVIGPRGFLLTLWKGEAALGRKRPSRPAKGPRPIDLDLLLWRTLTIRSALLTLPHPAISTRPFVLQPLSDLFGCSVSPPIAPCELVTGATLLD